MSMHAERVSMSVLSAAAAADVLAADTLSGGGLSALCKVPNCGQPAHLMCRVQTPDMSSCKQGACEKLCAEPSFWWPAAFASAPAVLAHL